MLKCSFLLSLVFVVLPPRFVSASPQNCSGCQGSGMSSQTTTQGLRTVKITITVGDGACIPDGSGGCAGYACETNVLREWVLPQNTTMEFCSQVNPLAVPPNKEECRDPKPSSGSTGAGSDTETKYIGCNTSVKYTIKWPTVMQAETTGTCAACQGL